MTDRNQLDAQRSRTDAKSLKIRILLWLIGLIFLGSLVCLILGILKTLFTVIVIVAAVIFVIGLIVSYIYERMKWKIDESRYRSEQEKLEDELNRRNNR